VHSRVLLLAGFGAAAAALVAFASRGFAQTIPNPSPSSTASGGISVMGTGIVQAQPDTARITLGVDVFDQSLANAQAEAARRMDAVVNKLKSEGIADADIHTVNYTVSPQYDYSNQNQPVLRGYEVQNLVEIKTTNLSGLGQLLDDAVGAGATRIYGIQFEASNVEDLKAQARDQAMQNARAKGEQLARDAGVGLGRPTLIEESQTGGVTPVRALAAPAASVAGAPPTPIQPGELSIQTDVHVIWSIQ
jgi:uncharacterized protein YggE